ncbi:MAG: FGGY family carbohydrate kinase [Candidatus Sumerlaeia bacterium]
MFLGIDFGTSKIALVVLDEHGTSVHVASEPHTAALEGKPGRYEQDADLLLEKAWDMVAALSDDMRRNITTIGLTGQMHGVIPTDDAVTFCGPFAAADFSGPWPQRFSTFRPPFPTSAKKPHAEPPRWPSA